MIIINSYSLLAEPITGFAYYHCQIEVDDLAHKGIIPRGKAEIDGQWNEQKALDYLDTRYESLLASARNLNVQVITKKLEVVREVEASDFIVASPSIPTDSTEAQEKIMAERKKAKKSVATIDLCLTVVVEDLVKRVESIESKFYK